MPIELMIAPRWFPINIWRVSYWSRTVVIPLLVLMHLRPQARNRSGIGVPELFTEPPGAGASTGTTRPIRSAWGHAFHALDRVLQVLEAKRLPRRARAGAVSRKRWPSWWSG